MADHPSNSRRARLSLTALLPLLLPLLLLAAAERASSQPADDRPAIEQPTQDKLEAARESVGAHRYVEAIPLLKAELVDHPEDDDALLAGANRLTVHVPAGTDPDADLINWYATINAGEPYDGNPQAADVVDEITTHHSSYYIDQSIPPAPLSRSM